MVEKLKASCPYTANQPIELPECIMMEHVVGLLNDWLQYVSNFRHHIGEDGFPYLLHKSFVVYDNGDTGSAIRHSRSALENAILFLERSDDHLHKEVYAHFVEAWVLENSTTPALKPSVYDLDGDIRVQFFASHIASRAPRKIITCLLLNDPFIADLDTVLRSRHFICCMALQNS